MNINKNPFVFRGICNVEEQYQFFYSYLLNKLNSVFTWEGLPDSVSETFLNSTLFLEGIVSWWKDDSGEIRATNCAYGGRPNEYYRPEDVVIANPILGSKVLKIGEDCVVMKCTDTDEYVPIGLRALLEQYATMLADNIVSINCAQINTRVQTLIAADSHNVKVSGEEALKQLYGGKPFTIMEQDLIDKFTITPLNVVGKGQISELIGLHNYILANFYKSIGIMDNEVDKKERLVVGEIESQKGQTGANLFDMLKQRVEAVEKINEMFGTSIVVKVNPIFFSQYEDRDENIDDVTDVLEPKDEVVEEQVDAIDGNKDSGMTEEGEVVGEPDDKETTVDDGTALDNKEDSGSDSGDTDTDDAAATDKTDDKEEEEKEDKVKEEKDDE